MIVIFNTILFNDGIVLTFYNSLFFSKLIWRIYQMHPSKEKYTTLYVGLLVPNGSALNQRLALREYCFASPEHMAHGSFCWLNMCMWVVHVNGWLLLRTCAKWHMLGWYLNEIGTCAKDTYITMWFTIHRIGLAYVIIRNKINKGLVARVFYSIIIMHTRLTHLQSWVPMYLVYVWRSR